MTTVGFIGLGNMGGAMATHLVEGGYDVTVFDLEEDARERLDDAGATVARDPAAVAEASDVVFLSLPTPDTVRAVVEGADGIEAGAHDGLILVDTTTSIPETTNTIADHLASAGVTVLSAPISGGTGGARAGTLTTIVGGDSATVEQCKPLFETYATNVYHVGESPGDGHVVKLLNNYLSFLGLLGASEAVALGERLGLDADTMLDVFNESSGRNAATEEKLPNEVVTEDYDFGMPVKLIHKDITLFSRLADDTDAPVLLGDMVRNLIGYAKADLGADADMTRIYQFVADHVNHDEDT